METNLLRQISWAAACAFLAVMAGFFVFPYTATAQVAEARGDKAFEDRITNLLQEIKSLQDKLTTSSKPASSGSSGLCVFDRDLAVGVSGDDVLCLQRLLFDLGFIESEEFTTGYFGPITRGAVATWQESHNVLPALGYFGPISQAAYAGTSVSDSTAKTVPQAGSELRVLSTSTENARRIVAPLNTARIPLVSFLLAASNDGDVEVNGLEVGSDDLPAFAAFTKVQLLNENNVPIGASQPLGGDLRITFNTPLTIPAGEVRFFKLVGHRSSQAVSANEAISFSLLGVDAHETTVVGTLPLRGNSIVLDTLQQIESVTIERGSRDPNRARTVEPSNDPLVFSSITITPGQRGPVALTGIRWHQSGTASFDAISDVSLRVGDEVYTPTFIDDRYVLFTIDDVQLSLGEKIEASIEGLVTGGSGKTIQFDIVDPTDVVIEGIRSGHTIVPPTFGVQRPDHVWRVGSRLSVTEGQIVIQELDTSSPSVTAISIANQELAAFHMAVYGEEITADQIMFSIESVGSETALPLRNFETDVITNIILEGPHGVVAGPVDLVGSKLALEDVTFPIGAGTYRLKGTVSKSFEENALFQFTTRPLRDWKNLSGSVTGSASLASSNHVSGGEYTAKSTILALSVEAPAQLRESAQYSPGEVIPFAVYRLDGSNASEDIRIASLNLRLVTEVPATEHMLSSCRLTSRREFALMRDDNVVTPRDSESGETFYLFSFDTNLIVPKGGEQTLILSCTAVPGANVQQSGSVFQWGVSEAADITANASGVISGNDAVITIQSSDGPRVTVLPL